MPHETAKVIDLFQARVAREKRRLAKLASSLRPGLPKKVETDVPPAPAPSEAAQSKTFDPVRDIGPLDSYWKGFYSDD